MSLDEETVIRRAYAEASLAAKEKGLTGIRAMTAVLSATAKVATRVLGRQVLVDEVERVLGRA